MKKTFILILGIIIGTSITAYAAYKYNANEIGYTPGNENWKVENVDTAIKELYKRVSNIELELGETYSMGGYEWIAAEEIDGGYVMQSTGMTTGTWPGYKLTSNYNGTKSYGSANTVYKNDIAGDNIANYDSVTSAFYTSWNSVELTSALYGKGLYLASYEQCGGTGIYLDGIWGGNYWLGNKIAAANEAEVSSNGYGFAWLGTLYDYTNGYVWHVRQDGTLIQAVHTGLIQSSAIAIAPAFNLDASKVYLDGTTIKKK